MCSVSYHPGDILRETVREVYGALGSQIEGLTVDRTVIGLFFTGVKLNSGTDGLCFTPIKTIPEAVCCPSSARVMPASGKLKGRNVTQFIDEMFGNNPIKRALGIAVLNALSALCWKKKKPQSYKIRIDAIGLEEMSIPPGYYVVLVGALIPSLRALKQRGVPFTVLELDSSTLKKDELEFFAPFGEAQRIVPRADLLIITGTTLINDTLEDLLRMRRREARAVVVGPTVSMLPDAFFRRGVNAMGGNLVTDADSVLDVLAEGGSGYHFFGKGADRIVIEPVRQRVDQ